MYNILICDDEKDIVEALSIYLSSEGYNIYKAYNGMEALEMVTRETIHLVLLDIMMPKMDGITVLKKIREQNILLPVIMLTAKAEVDDKVLGLDSGANDYLTKPFDSKELLARIRAITRQKQNADSTMRFGNISLDRASFTLSSPSGSFRLANKEFQMMEIFMANPKCLVSSERLLERIWGYDSDAEINVVWVYISYLRKKLSALQADIQIRAIRNAGYTLEELP